MQAQTNMWGGPADWGLGLATYTIVSLVVCLLPPASCFLPQVDYAVPETCLPTLSASREVITSSGSPTQLFGCVLLKVPISRVAANRLFTASVG